MIWSRSIARSSATLKAGRFDSIVAKAATTPDDAELGAWVRTQITAPSEPRGSGDAFVATLGLAALQSFFTAKKLYNGKPQLKELLIDRRTSKLRPRAGSSVFAGYRKARDAVAHYKLGSELSFAQALYTAAQIAGGRALICSTFTAR